MKLAPGSVFAGYRIIRLLGQGGMGAVYLAAHPRLPRNDALKVLSGLPSSDAAFRARFAREADIAARLRHPNIVSIYDRGDEGDELWISMQYVDGRDVADLIKAGPRELTIPRVVGIVKDVGKALDYAHREGLLHRDVKPANILVAPPVDQYSQESALLADFGIARVMASAQSGLTVPGDVLGTVAYAAPEQLTGRNVDHRGDIYALGCTLYEMITGTKPFRGESMIATIHQHLSAPPPRPSQVRPGLPPAMDAVIARALAKDPNQRYPSCHDLVDDAARALHVVPPPTAPSLPPAVAPARPVPADRAAPATPPSRRRGVAIAAVVLAVLLVAIGVAVVVLNSGSTSSSGGTTSTTPVTTTTTTQPRPSGAVAKALDASFEVTLPNGWRSEKPNGLLKLVADDGLANILVDYNLGTGRGQTVEESAEITSKALVTDLNGMIDSGGIESTTVGGDPAARYTYTLPVSAQVQTEARGRQLFVRHGDVEYVVTFTGAPTAFNRAVAGYETIIASWKWLK